MFPSFFRSAARTRPGFPRVSTKLCVNCLQSLDLTDTSVVVVLEQTVKMIYLLLYSCVSYFDDVSLDLTDLGDKVNQEPELQM